MTLEQILELERQNVEQQIQAKLRASREVNRQSTLNAGISIMVTQTQMLLLASFIGAQDERTEDTN